LQQNARIFEPAQFRFENQIIDQHNRVFNYLRISVIEQCNLRCIYCLPEEGIDLKPLQKLLTYDEILRIINIVSCLGISKIRYTGGEPLIRKDMTELVQETANTPGIQSVHLTTNGLLLYKYAEGLKKAGLHGINISLDTFDAARFFKISRREGVEKVLSNLKLAVDLGFPSVKVNVVVMRGFNDDELGKFAELTRSEKITVRFIELMPFDAHQIWKTGHYLGAEKILQKMKKLFPQMEKAKGSSTEQHIYSIPGYKGKIAVIPSFTRSLCEGCTRIRLTADGNIRNCLYSEEEFNLLAKIRNGANDEEIGQFFKDAMWQKAKDGWESQKTNKDKVKKHHRDSMTQIGG